MTRKKDRDGTGAERVAFKGDRARSLEVNLCLNRETDQGDNRKTLSKDYPPPKKEETFAVVSPIHDPSKRQTDFRVGRRLALPYPSLLPSFPAACFHRRCFFFFHLARRCERRCWRFLWNIYYSALGWVPSSLLAPFLPLLSCRSFNIFEGSR